MSLEGPLHTPLSELILPARMRTFARRRGIVTVGDLLARDPREVAGQKNIGKGTIDAVRRVLERELGVLWEPKAAPRWVAVPRPAPDEGAEPSGVTATTPPGAARDGVLEFWRRGVEGLSEPGATVLRYRSGLDGDVRDIPWIAARLTITPTTTRRLERKALDALVVDPASFNPLHELLRWNLRDGVHRVAELVAIDPWFASAAEAPRVAEYVLRHLFGRRVSLEAHDGAEVAAPREVEMWQRAPPVEALGPPPSPPAVEMRADALDTSLDSMPLTRRMRNVVEDLEIATVRDLVALDPRALIARKNVGRKTIRDLKGLLAHAFGLRWDGPQTAAPAPDPPPPAASPPPEAPRLSLNERRAARLAAHASLVEFWRTAAQRLDATAALVLDQRAGLEGPPKRLHEIAKALGRSKQRVQQIEDGALRIVGEEGTLFAAIERRFLPHLREGARRVADLVGDDPWFDCFQDRPHFACFLLQRVFQVRLNRLTLDGEAVVATWEGAALHARWDPLVTALRGQRWPAPRSQLDALVREAAAPLGPVAEQIFSRRVADQVVLDGTDPAVVVGYENKRHASIEAFLAEAPGPVSVAELTRRFGRRPLPRGAVHCDSGLVTLDRRLDGFDAFAARAVPACADWMRRHGPRRHWSCAELVDVAADLSGAPPWLNPWTLAAMCTRRAEVRYLGRSLIALSTAPKVRTHMRDTVVEVLTSAGRPLSRDDLLGRVMHRRAVTSFALTKVLCSPPCVEVAPGLWGLRDRDLPGGEAAARHATDVVARALAARGSGLSTARALALVRALGAPLSAWSAPMVASVVRGDPRLRAAPYDAVGLAAWADIRLPSRAEVLRRCLDAGDGRVSLALVHAEIERSYGEPMGKKALAALVYAADARVTKGYVVRRAPSGAAPRAQEP